MTRSRPKAALKRKGAARSSAFLLDVNALIALFDPLHEAHAGIRAWYAANAMPVATCPLTELGFVRICSHPRYTNPLGAPAEALALLRALHAESRHVFWPDELSLAADAFARVPFASHRETTDRYLLRLAVGRNGRLLTLDARIEPADAEERAALCLFGQAT